MTIKTKTTTNTTVEVQVALDKILAEVFEQNPELKDGFTRTNSTLVGGPSDRTLVLTFGRRTFEEKELKAPEFPMELRQRPENPDGLTAEEFSSQRRVIVREALGTASTFYIGATTEDRAKVEEAIITAWKDSGTSDALSAFALPYYRSNLRDRYNTTTGRFEFPEPVGSPPAFTQAQRDEVRRVLVSSGSDSFTKSTPEVQELVITRCLEMLDGKPFSYNWYLDNLHYPDYQENGQKFSFAPWQPTAEQVTEARDILDIRIPFSQLSEDDKSKAVLEVLRKWHEDGEKESLRNADLYVNYFKGSELYLSTEFGKQNQGRI